jgi:ABC-2 type transport system ATP-binding protein
MDTEQTPLLKVWDLKKTFGKGRNKVEAVKGISFEIPKGQVVGLLGPNGAGKSTALALILGLLVPDEGGGVLEGAELGSKAARGSLGFLPEHVTLPGFYSVNGFLKTVLSMSGNANGTGKGRLQDIVRQCGLGSHGHVRISTLSAGLRQRVGWAQALLHSPRFMILDEPTSNLDPEGRAQAKMWIQEAKKEGASALLSTHILSDVEEVADRILIMFDGKIAADIDLAKNQEKSLEETYMAVVGKARA